MSPPQSWHGHQHFGKWGCSWAVTVPCTCMCSRGYAMSSCQSVSRVIENASSSSSTTLGGFNINANNEHTLFGMFTWSNQGRSIEVVLCHVISATSYYLFISSTPCKFTCDSQHITNYTVLNSTGLPAYIEVQHSTCVCFHDYTLVAHVGVSTTL